MNANQTTIRTFLMLMLWPIVTAGGRSDDPIIVGYLPEYRMSDVVPEHLKPLTDLIYFGLVPSKDGTIPDAAVSASVLGKLHEIKRVAECRLLICVGGWERSDNFSAIAGSRATRLRFISSLSMFCRDNGFDGVDFDWEHPKDAREIADFGQLVAETRTAFADKRLLVTVAQAGWQDLGKIVYNNADRVHLMAYDHVFPQASLKAATADVDRLLEAGCPSRKIALGVPFYGRRKDGTARAYCELLKTRTTAPAEDIFDGFAFNGTNTLRRKVELIRKRNLAGIMIWEIGQDTVDAETSLLRVIEEPLRRGPTDDSSRK